MNLRLNIKRVIVLLALIVPIYAAIGLPGFASSPGTVARFAASCASEQALSMFRSEIEANRMMFRLALALLLFQAGLVLAMAHVTREKRSGPMPGDAR